MARSRSGFVRGRPSTRRATAWGFGPGGTSFTAISSSASAFIGSAIVPTEEGMTIVRIRGDMVIGLTLATGAVDGFTGAVGIGVTTAVAVTGGIGSVPTPITEQDWDGWMWHQFIQVFGPVASSTDIAPAVTSQRVSIDTKAMRKLPDEMIVYAALELVESGTATASLAFDTRMLIKLS